MIGVDEIDPDCFMAHQNLAGTHIRDIPFDQLHHLRSAIALDLDTGHFAHDTLLVPIGAFPQRRL